jgi:hypothetical protein
MPTPIPASSYPLLMNLINQTYLDRVERIDGAQVDDGDNIICAATDGRKALAVRVTDDEIDIKLREAQARSPQFAAPSKKKNCKTGISCGMSCISASKTCSKKTTPNQRVQKKKIVADAKGVAGKTEPGGALTIQGGRLSTTAKEIPLPKEKARTKGVNNLIDEKYASENPSLQDVDNWVKERIEARTNPTDENIAQRVADNIALDAVGSHMQGLFDPTPAGKEFRDRVVDRESYAAAMIASDNLERELRPQPAFTRSLEETEAHWKESLNSSEYRLSEKQIATANKTLSNPSASEKTKAAAAAKLTKHKKILDLEPANAIRARDLAERTFNRYQGSPEQRAQAHFDRFDKEVDGAKRQMARDKDALNNAAGRARLAESMPTGYDEDGGKRSPRDYLKFIAENPPIANDVRTKSQVKSDYRRDAAKYHPDNKATGDAEGFRRVQQAYERKMRTFE